MRARLGFFSFTEITDPNEHRAYNEWHQFDHLPEQFRIEGMLRGDRWVASPACAEARLVGHHELDRAHYLTLYLVGEPETEALVAFASLAHELRAEGRFHEHRFSWLNGAWEVDGARAAPRVLVAAEVVPWRPARGVYVIVRPVEAGDGRGGHEPGSRLLDALVAVDGVAGAWTFVPQARHHNPHWRLVPDGAGGPVALTVLWLDGDPLVVAEALVDRVPALVPDVLFAGPYASIAPGEWSWFEAAADDGRSSATA